jgi:hypothetical protein
MLSKILEKPPKRLIIPFCGPNVDRFYDVWIKMIKMIKFKKIVLIHPEGDIKTKNREK